MENRLTDRQVTPHFYVNVADIETLETEMAYIACKLFTLKKDVYPSSIYYDFIPEISKKKNE